MKNLLLLSLLIFTVACSSESENPKLYGNWNGISWNVNGQDSGRNASDLTFNFKADDTYILDYQGQKEEGTFRLTGSKLYTTEKCKK